MLGVEEPYEVLKMSAGKDGSSAVVGLLRSSGVQTMNLGFEGVVSEKMGWRGKHKRYGSTAGRKEVGLMVLYQNEGVFDVEVGQRLFRDLPVHREQAGLESGTQCAVVVEMDDILVNQEVGIDLESDFGGDAGK